MDGPGFLEDRTRDLVAGLNTFNLVLRRTEIPTLDLCATEKTVGVTRYLSTTGFWEPKKEVYNENKPRVFRHKRDYGCLLYKDSNVR